MRLAVMAAVGEMVAVVAVAVAVAVAAWGR